MKSSVESWGMGPDLKFGPSHMRNGHAKTPTLEALGTHDLECRCGFMLQVFSFFAQPGHESSTFCTMM